MCMKIKKGHHYSNELSQKAETEGFEPSIEFPLYTLSRRAPSTTRTSLRLLKILPLASVCFHHGVSALAEKNMRVFREGKNTVSMLIRRIFFQRLP